MINHARNLLLNTKRGQLNSLPGAEYIPDDFVPLSLPPAAALIFQILYGPRPDGFKLNYRSQELLTLLHATPFDEYLRALDPRITYWPFSSRLFDLLTGPSAVLLQGAHNLTLGGTPPEEYRGALYFSWQITAENSSQLAVVQSIPQTRSDLLDLTFVDGFSQPVTIPGTRLTIQLPPPTAGDRWVISTVTRPTSDLATLTWQLQQLPGGTLEWVFGDITSEPWKTFHNAWQHTWTTLKMAGFLTALIYRLNTLYGKGG